MVDISNVIVPVLNHIILPVYLFQPPGFRSFQQRDYLARGRRRRCHGNIDSPQRRAPQPQISRCVLLN